MTETVRSKVFWIFVSGIVGALISEIIKQATQASVFSFANIPFYWFIFMPIIVGAVIIMIINSRKQMGSKLVRKTSERENIPSNLDPKLYHLTAALFWPKNKSDKDRRPSVLNPRYKGIMNRSTMKAYWFSGDVDSWIIQRKISWTNHDWEGEEAYKKFFTNKGYELIEHIASPHDIADSRDG